MNQKYTLEIKAEAGNDIRNAYDWYESKSKNLGESFKNHVDKTIKAIIKTPNGFKVIKGNIRQVPVKRFPYLVVYEVFDSTIVIFAVFHMSRNPEDKP